MADVDRLDIASGIDTTGIDTGLAQGLAKIDQFARSVAAKSLPALDINTSALRASLSAAGSDIGAFFADLSSKAGRADLLGGIADELSTNAVQFKATSAEAKAYQAVIEDVRQSEQRLRAEAVRPQFLPEIPLATPARVGGAEGARFDDAAGRFRLPDTGQFVAGAKVAADQTELLSTQLIRAQQAGATLEPTLDRVAAGMSRAGSGALTYEAGLRKLETQQLATADAAALNARITAQFASAATVSSNIDPMARGLENIRLSGAGAREELTRGVVAFESHATGARKATNALALLAATSVGAEGPVARLAESALLFSGGELAIVGVAGAVLAVAEAYQFLNTKQREADDRNKALVAGLRQEVETLGAAEKAARGLAAAIDEEAKARQSLLAQVARPAAKVLSIVLDPAATGAGIGTEIRRRQEEGITNAIKAQQQARADQGTAEIALLTQSLQVETATTGQRERALELVKSLTSQEHSLLVPAERRLEVARQLAGLEASLNLSTGARLAGETQAIQAENALRQQALKGEEADLKAAFDQEAITRTTSLDAELQARSAFYDKRRTLATAAARSDEQALRAQIDVVQQRPTTDSASRITRDNEIAGLRAQLALRELILAAQLRTIENEKRLAELTPLQKLGDLAPLTSLGPQDASNDVIKLRARFDTSELTAGLRQEVSAVLQGVADDALDRELRLAAASGETLQRVLEGVDLALKDIGNADISSPAAQMERLANAAFDIAQAADGFSAIGQQIGFIDEQTAKALRGVSELSQGIGRIAQGDVIGGVIQGIQGGIDLIGGLFGKSESEKLLEQAQKDNTAALKDATNAFKDRFVGGAGIADQQAILRKVLDSPAAQKAIQDDDTTAFNAAVEATGTTLDDLREIGRAYGISLVQDHKLVDDAANVLDKALRAAAEAATQFSDSADARRTQLEVEDKLGISDRSSDPAVARLQRERELQLGRANDPTGAGLHLDPATEARIRALDLSTAEGRAAFLKEEQDLFRRAKAGGLSVDELGTFATVDDLVNSLGSSADALDALANAADNASKQLLGVPDFFKLGEAEFAARGIGPNDGASLPAFPGAPLGAFPEGPRGTDLNVPLPPGLTTVPVVSSKSFVFTGPVILQFPTTPQNPAELVRAVKSGAIRIALATTGSDDVGI